MQSTIQLFRYLYEHLPPLFPDESAVKMKHALEHVEKDQTLSLEQIEDTMIAFGYEVWPWNQAYREFLVLAENKLGEHFLLPRLSTGLQEKYLDFKHAGGTLRDLHSGRPADFFSSDERGELCAGLVDMQNDLREYVDRQVVGTEEQKYLQRVENFTRVLEDIKQKLFELAELAANEQDHPSLASEIRARVRAFEQGMCLLAPELHYEAVCSAGEFFAGRRADLNRLRGIHVPKEIDFYAENV